MKHVSRRLARVLPARLQAPALLAAAVVAIAAGVWFSSAMQRAAAVTAANQSADAQQMLTAMLDQETGVRGFALNRDDQFLEPYRGGRLRFEAAVAGARRDSSGDEPALRSLSEQVVVARRWQELAANFIVHTRAGRLPKLSESLLRKAEMDRFRQFNARFQRQLGARRAARMRHAGLLAAGVIVLLGALFGLVGAAIIRRNRREHDRAQHFAETLQVMRSEHEAHALLRKFLERALPDSVVTVLTRNNSADRLTASTDLEPGDALGDRLSDARPDSCMALRMAQPHTRDPREEPLLACELCGGGATGSTCEPLLVGGEVLGSVLVRGPGRPAAADTERVAEAVTRAAPALANLRNLAIAEARAQTDPLTRLANKRAIDDTLKRMHAHAARTGEPFSLVLADVDHFKRVNDTLGHDAGDAALAAVADALTATVRGGDFVGRLGGEEFIVALPDTPAAAAAVVAEHLRAAVASAHVTSVPDGLTASFGVATFPRDATDLDQLLKLGDRALYTAKNLGRDRVHVFNAAAESGPPTALHDVSLA